MSLVGRLGPESHVVLFTGSSLAGLTLNLWLNHDCFSNSASSGRILGAKKTKQELMLNLSQQVFRTGLAFIDECTWNIKHSVWNQSVSIEPFAILVWIKHSLHCRDCDFFIFFKLKLKRKKKEKNHRIHFQAQRMFNSMLASGQGGLTIGAENESGSPKHTYYNVTQTGHVCESAQFCTMSREPFPSRSSMLVPLGTGKSILWLGIISAQCNTTAIAADKTGMKKSPSRPRPATVLWRFVKMIKTQNFW